MRRDSWGRKRGPLAQKLERDEGRKDGEETVVTGEVDEGCKREGERSCNQTRTKTLLCRGSALMLQPRGLQPGTRECFVWWAGTRKNEGFT